MRRAGRPWVSCSGRQQRMTATTETNSDWNRRDFVSQVLEPDETTRTRRRREVQRVTTVKKWKEQCKETRHYTTWTLRRNIKMAAAATAAAAAGHHCAATCIPACIPPSDRATRSTVKISQMGQLSRFFWWEIYYCTAVNRY